MKKYGYTQSLNTISNTWNGAKMMGRLNNKMQYMRFPQYSFILYEQNFCVDLAQKQNLQSS